MNFFLQTGCSTTMPCLLRRTLVRFVTPLVSIINPHSLINRLAKAPHLTCYPEVQETFGRCFKQLLQKTAQLQSFPTIQRVLAPRNDKLKSLQ